MRRPTDYSKSLFNERVGQAVRGVRQAADLSIAKLADIIGISSAMLTNVEHGATPLPFYTARSIADAVDCTIDDLCPVTIDEREDS